MTSTVMLLCSITTLSMSPGLEDLLGTHSLYSWTLPSLLDWQTRITRDGTPLIVLGDEPIPGWGSFDGVELKSPLEAGVWGRGGWELDFTSPEIPDSSFSTGVGLLENTASMNRYSAYVRRPIPWGLDLDFSMDRDDTLKNQRVTLGFADLEAGGRAWEDTGNSHTFWLSYSRQDYSGRFSFSRLHQGGRQWEVLGSLQTTAGPIDVMAGAAGALSDDSVLFGEGHLRLESTISGVRLVARADVQDMQGEVDFGGTAGLMTDVGPLRLQAGAMAAPGSDLGFMVIAGSGPVEATVVTGPGGFSGGVQALALTRWGLGRAGAALRGDTLRFSGMLLPSLPWGANGRIHAGASWELTYESSLEKVYGTADVRSMFTLGSFAFIFAVEDVLDDWRSYTFGVTWDFSDLPPRRPQDEQED